MRQITIRRFTSKGSETTTYDVVEKAQRVVQEALARRSLVIDIDKSEVIRTITTEVEHILIVNPICGG